jgi:hypothetical protein
MPKRIPGPYDESVLPIQKADQELRRSLHDVLCSLQRFALRIKPYYLIGFHLDAIFASEKEDLEAELRSVADALANWRNATQGITEKAYLDLNRLNEAVRKQKMKENRRKS